MIAWKRFHKYPVVFVDDGIYFYWSGWYFYDETWSNIIGPFHSHMEAAAQLRDYCLNYLGE